MLLMSVLLKCLHSRKKVKRRRIKAPADDSSSTEGGELECSGKVRYSSEYWLYFDTFTLLSLKTAHTEHAWVLKNCMLVMCVLICCLCVNYTRKALKALWCT